MSFYVWCEIVCEGCADTIPGQHTKGGVPRRELAALAKRFKWQRRGDDWFCASCKLKDDQ